MTDGTVAELAVDSVLVWSFGKGGCSVGELIGIGSLVYAGRDLVVGAVAMETVV